jgi:apolipoprotein N-acyltransferase
MISKRTWTDLGVAAGCGVLMAATLPMVIPVFSREEILPGGFLEPLALFGLVPFLSRLRLASPRRAFGLAVLAGWLFFGTSLYWLDVAMTTFGRMPRVMSVPVLLLLTGFLSLFWGLAVWLAVRVRNRLDVAIPWTLPAAWVALEFLRNYVLTGFPWANLGTTQVRTLWLAQLASLGGVYLVAWVVVFSNTVVESLWAWWRRKADLPRAAVVVWAAILAFASIWSAVRLASSVPDQAPRLRVGAVQGNLDEKARLKGRAGQKFVMKRVLDAGLEASAEGARLVVFPEGTLPQWVRPDIRSFADTALRSGASVEPGSQLIIGGITRGVREGRVVLTNSAFFLDDQLRVLARYDKRHLVPFGEYVPLMSILPYQWFVPAGTAFFHPGADHQPVEIRAGRMGMLICYEAIFPEIARETVNAGAQLLVNITNDSWYGFSSAPHQHLAISRMRAIETGRYLVRAANTGISAFVDPAGRVLSRTEIGLAPTDEDFIAASELVAPAHLVQTVALLDDRTVYCVVGDLFAWLCVAFCLGLFALTSWPLRRVAPQQGK